jgi:hypothetical protein
MTREKGNGNKENGWIFSLFLAISSPSLLAYMARLIDLILSSMVTLLNTAFFRATFRLFYLP